MTNATTGVTTDAMTGGEAGRAVGAATGPGTANGTETGIGAATAIVAIGLEEGTGQGIETIEEGVTAASRPVGSGDEAVVPAGTGGAAGVADNMSPGRAHTL